MATNHKLSETEKAVELAKAQCKIGEFFRNNMSYSDLMEATAEAQATIMRLMEIDKDCMDETGGSNMSSVLLFFGQAMSVFRLIKPIASIEGGL